MIVFFMSMNFLCFVLNLFGFVGVVVDLEVFGGINLFIDSVVLFLFVFDGGLFGIGGCDGDMLFGVILIVIEMDECLKVLLKLFNMIFDNGMFEFLIG